MRYMHLPVQPTPNVRGEAALEIVAVGELVVGDDRDALFVVEGAPAKLVEAAILIAALGKIGAAQTDLRSWNLSIDQQIRFATLGIGRERILDLELGSRRCGFALRRREVGRQARAEARPENAYHQVALRRPLDLLLKSGVAE